MGIHSDEQYALLTDYDTDTAYSEAFQTLYANIRLNWENANSKQPQALGTTRTHTLLLTTPSASSEQSSVAANLAIVTAQSSIPTILVDANLRKPTLEQRFGLSKNLGLSDLLAQESITSQKIPAYLQTTFVPGLRILGAGTSPEQGASLLLSPKLEEVVSCLRQFLDETETQPGVVLFHSPPVLPGADASLISTLVDQTFLTIIKGLTTRTQAKQAQEQLQRAHAKLAGIIMLDA